MNMDVFILISTILGNALLGLLIVRKNCKPWINRLFLFIICLVILFAIGNYKIDTAQTPEAGLFWLRFFVADSYLFTGLFFFFILVFPGPIRFSRSLISHPILYVFFALVLALVPIVLFSPLIFRGVTIGEAGLEDVAFGSLYLPMFLIFFATIMASGIVLYKKYKHTRSSELHLQLKYIFWGWLTFFLGGIAFGGILPFFFPIAVNVSKVVPLFSLFMIGGTVLAVRKHQFLQIRVVVQRGLVYSILLSLIAAVYLALIFFLGFPFGRMSNTSYFMSAALTTIAGIFGVPRLEKYFRKITDKIFFKDTYNYPEAMQELSEVLNKNLDLSVLLRDVTLALRRIMRTDEVSIVLAPQEGSSDRRNSVRVPIMLEERTLGIIVLGRRLSGDLYTREDLAFLRTFSYQAAVAVEKAKLYEQVKEYSEQLEKKVKARTIELENLQEKQHAMMADISHAIQTPLTVVKIEFDMLKKQLPWTRDLETFEKSIDRVSGLTYDLLKLARLETSQTDFSKTSVSLSQLLDGLIEYFIVLARDKDITVLGDIAPDVTIFGDKKSLEELATNLLSNTVKYMGESGEKRVVIKLSKNEKAAILTIQDTGIGISPEDLPHIFDRFYRASNTAQETKGAGLGLAICKAIVEKHSGTIEVESEFGKGTKFTITFPLG